MKQSEYTGNYYTMGHITQFTGLTDRTIRNYIAQGFLTGEKINGVWHFLPENVEAFLKNPAVRPSVIARSNGIVYDALVEVGSKQDMCCMILDLPEGQREDIAEFFCDGITDGEFHDLSFSFDGVSPVPRVILRGPAKDVVALAQAYYRRGM